MHYPIFRNLLVTASALLCAVATVYATPQPQKRTSSLESRVSFVNDVVPVFTRVGCNQGPCHGAAIGKGGFKLSLRGFAPEMDYVALTRQSKGRRVCVSQPERSLVLRKPLLDVPHLGGAVLRRGTPEFTILSRWIAEGAPGPASHDAHLDRLESLPPTSQLRPHGMVNLHILAHFSNGTTRDVTHWARFGTNDENVASVTPSGTVEMNGSGETAITVSYQDKVAFSRVAVPFPNAIEPDVFHRLPANSYVDSLVYRKLSALHLLPSSICSDETYAFAITDFSAR